MHVRMTSKIVCGILFSGLLACSSGDFETIVVRGSDTEVNLALDLAETYMDQNEKVSIAVTGGGSGVGIAALINGKTDIANSSRAFKEEEAALALKRGVKVTPIIFAVDALVFIVHPAIGVDSLTIDQVADIFSGRISNWQSLGGEEAPISIYGRQSNSGTFIYIQENILKGEYTTAMKQMNGTAQIIESVKNDPHAIGYTGIGYIINKAGQLMKGIKVLQIKENEKAPAVNPLNEEAIKGGDYVVTRPLFQYTDGVPEGAVKRFIQFELSEAGQAIVERNGYFPITPKERQYNQQAGIGYE